MTKNTLTVIASETKQSPVKDMDKNYYVYIVTNKTNRVVYTGITNDLKRRLYEHKTKIIEGFTKKYKVTKLVYFEIFDDVRYAIMQEKQIKGGSRNKKIELINSLNDKWNDLYHQLY
jgi:putative endonuclease